MRQGPMKIQDFKLQKNQKKKISMITCYDYPSARIIAESSIDCVLVGDSVAMVVHGHDTTMPATLEMMILHTAAVARGLGPQFLVSDLPFLAHRMGLPETMSQVKQLMQAGAHAIKIEGADFDTLKTIRYLVDSGISVMGHIGLTPQSVHQLGGYRVQGKQDVEAMRLIEQAYALEESGCFAIVIECVPKPVAKTITENLLIPTIGIGAGVETDGQVLVWHDMLGLQTEIKPKFIKQYAVSKDFILQALHAYADDVHHAYFPTEAESY